MMSLTQVTQLLKTGSERKLRHRLDAIIALDPPRDGQAQGSVFNKKRRFGY